MFDPANEACDESLDSGGRKVDPVLRTDSKSEFDVDPTEDDVPTSSELLLRTIENAAALSAVVIDLRGFDG